MRRNFRRCSADSRSKQTGGESVSVAEEDPAPNLQLRAIAAVQPKSALPATETTKGDANRVTEEQLAHHLQPRASLPLKPTASVPATLKQRRASILM